MLAAGRLQLSHRRFHVSCGCDSARSDTLSGSFINVARRSVRLVSRSTFSAMDGTNSVQRFILPGLTTDISYSGTESGTGALYYALDRQVASGAPHTTAVSLGTDNDPHATGGPLQKRTCHNRKANGLCAKIGDSAPGCTRRSSPESAAHVHRASSPSQKCGAVLLLRVDRATHRSS
jgi:hypothetical protein